MSDEQPHLLLKSTVAHKSKESITLQSWSALGNSALSNLNYPVCSSGQDLHFVGRRASEGFATTAHRRDSTPAALQRLPEMSQFAP